MFITANGGGGNQALAFAQSAVSTLYYLSPEGLEVMTQSKYSLAAMESSTLFTSLVKLPSTCLLLIV